MFRGKSPGVTILWIWALGTAAVLVTNVVTTRMRDMEKLLNEEASKTQSDPPPKSTVDTILEEDS